MSENKIVITEGLEKLSLKLKSKAEIFIVGGYVRNSLLDQGTTDIDIASRLSPEEITSLLKYSEFSVKEKSKKMGTVVITYGNESFEHTTFRKEVYAEGGNHCPINTEFVDDIRLDARRRDFTVNAIYYSITKKRYIDIYSGIYDLEKKRIKCIESPEFVFENDGLRILRMIRLAVELNFKIDKFTYHTAKKMAYLLKDITGSRKQIELKKILDSSERYERSSKKAYIRGLNYFNALRLWPMFYAPVAYVKFWMLKKVNSENRLIALLIDIINSVNPDCVEYYLKEILGHKGLAFGEKYKNYLINIVCGYFDALNKRGNKEYFFKYFENFEIIKEFLQIKNRFLYSKYNFFYKYIINHKIPITIKDLKINGDDIKKLRPKMPEKYYGILLKELLDRVFIGEITNDKDVLLGEIKSYEYNRNI